MIHPHVRYLGPAYPDASGPASLRELDSRVSDGIQVDLMWCERTGRAWVVVTDSRTGEAFSLPVRDGERPLDVFHHPYAYAASHGVNARATSAGLDSGVAQAA